MVNQFARYILTSNTYVTIPILGCITYVYCVHQLTVDPYFIFLVAATLILYPAHRLYGAYTATSPNVFQQHAWKNKFPTFIILGLATAVTGYFGFQLSAQLIYLLIPLFLIAISYSFPLLRWGGKWRKLREVPLLKSLLIALVVSGTCYLIPMLNQAPQAPALQLWAVTVQYLFFIIAITLPFDIRDMDYDYGQKLATIPLVFGVTPTRTISIVCLLISVAINFQFTEGPAQWSWSITAFILIPFFTTHITKRSFAYYALVFEGALVQLPLWYAIFTVFAS